MFYRLNINIAIGGILCEVSIDITYKIEEIANPIAEQPGVRIGVLKLK